MVEVDDEAGLPFPPESFDLVVSRHPTVVLWDEVLWTVPGFTADGYREQLARLHDRIQTEGPFVSHARRFLIEAHKPR